MDVKPTQVVLLAPHEHARVRYAAGDTLTLDAGSAAWLVAAGVAVLAEPAAAPPGDSLSPGDAPAPTKGKR